MLLDLQDGSLRDSVVAVCGVLALVTLGGCRSAYVEANIKNESGTTIPLAELDYPSASFGTESLANGGVYHYRFKILGSGATKILWTDAAQHEHSFAGPQLHEGQEGSLVVTITASGANWSTKLHS